MCIYFNIAKIKLYFIYNFFLHFYQNCINNRCIVKYNNIVKRPSGSAKTHFPISLLLSILPSYDYLKHKPIKHHMIKNCRVELHSTSTAEGFLSIPARQFDFLRFGRFPALVSFRRTGARFSNFLRLVSHKLLSGKQGHCSICVPIILHICVRTQAWPVKPSSGTTTSNEILYTRLDNEVILLKRRKLAASNNGLGYCEVPASRL